MSTFEQVQPGIWSWPGTDADHGFPIVGHIIALGDELALVDPPKTSGSESEIRALGRPGLIAVTNGAHVRGAGRWASAFGIPVVGPASAAAAAAEEGVSLARTLDEGDEDAGWRVLRLRATDGDKVFDELAYFRAADGVLVIGDAIFLDDDGAVKLCGVEYTGLTHAQVTPQIARLAALAPKLLLGGHTGPRPDGAELLARAAALRD